MQARLACDDAQVHGWLLDGYPRSAEQAEAIEEAGIRPDIFILIEARSWNPGLHVWPDWWVWGSTSRWRCWLCGA